MTNILELTEDISFPAMPFIEDIMTGVPSQVMLTNQLSGRLTPSPGLKTSIIASKSGVAVGCP